MKVDLRQRAVSMIGSAHAIAQSVVGALKANGAQVDWPSPGASGRELDIVVVSHDLTPAGTQNSAALLAEAETAAASMSAYGRGRIIHLISALGVIPMRRHPALSMQAAGIVASVRTLAMASAPHVLVNAIAAGLIESEGAVAAGDFAMSSHVPSGKAGTVDDIAHAALFLADPMNTYTTGQVLVVDGGWTAGYGRNF